MPVLARILRGMIRQGALTIVDARGRTHRFGTAADGWPEVTMRFADGRIARAILRDPVMGVGEAWMDGRLMLERGTMLDLLTLVRGNTPWEAGRRFGRRRALRLDRVNWARRARRNVAHHYDLSDRLYELFLDPDLTYSCAYFREPEARLERAQADKMAHIAAKLALKPGMRVLDIGCGWGGLALYLHRVAGVDVTGITLSERQLAIARARAAAAAVGERVRFELLDYRAVEGRFDRIVSVGMFEHVGPPCYRRFFDTCRTLLAEDGVMLLHTIGLFGSPEPTDAWLRKYIFPGGHLPALSEIVRASEAARLMVSDVETLRLHYALTIEHWLARAEAHRAEIEALYDTRFFRMWTFYLAGAIAMFRHGELCNYQIQYVGDRRALPITRDYMAEAEAGLRGR
ncbi:cyclopropane-fatty-acyl-phospholipid synthase family protein [Sphingosinicella sp. BN140058]|uniref:SAM-dependent methyltransferase n=1 Tax=Sphingosinicella sp. BN140058 TaxID=1892855 RepID=UPI001012DA40|nr:cyclopropane-fatty-acyl-phospholipid synthase family protein [Sphingosinicella sp. BN140058]QAY80016.1 class I SAM-dependent methyltransferase [Sphingosinicella sp. BN140058]